MIPTEFVPSAVNVDATVAARARREVEEVGRGEHDLADHSSLPRWRGPSVSAREFHLVAEVRADCGHRLGSERAFPDDAARPWLTAGLIGPAPAKTCAAPVDR